MIRTSMFRTSLGAKHLAVLRYFSRVIIALKLIITYIRIEISYKNDVCIYICAASITFLPFCWLFYEAFEAMALLYRFRTRGINCVVITIKPCLLHEIYLYFYEN